MTIYADILLLVNFSMDFLTLYLTGRLLHKPCVKSRLVIAAAAGSAGGTIRTILVSEPTVIGTALSGLILSVLMVLIAFGKYTSSASCIRDSLAVWGCGIFIGGFMTFCTTVGGVSVVSDSGASAFTVLFLICFAASSVIIRIVSSTGHRKSAVVSVVADGREYSFAALCDTGSSAADPITGIPVIIVRSGIMQEIENEMLGCSGRLRIRMIPVSGIGGECVLTGFIPDSVKIDGKEKEAVIAVMKQRGDFSGYSGIIPAALCT